MKKSKKKLLWFEGRGHLVTFLSHYTTDRIIRIISNMIKSTIAKKVKEANMFPVSY